MLSEPRALAVLFSHPPPPPPKADDPPLFSCCPQPLEELLGFCTLFQLPPLLLSNPLPVFLYWVPFTDAYLLPFAV